MLSKLFCAIAAPLMFSAQSVLANNVPAGYSVVDLEWALPIDPRNASSEIVTVTGTIEHAIAKMDAKHPGWNQTFINSIAPPSMLSKLAPKAERESYKCGDPWYQTSRQSIIDGANYLRGVKTAPPKNGPGPGNCGRVSCSYGGAIWWCNENNFAKQVTWTEIGDSAYFLAYQCDVWNDITWLTSGQEFFKDKWSVYVTAAAC